MSRLMLVLAGALMLGTGVEGSSHAGSTRSACSVAPLRWTKTLTTYCRKAACAAASRATGTRKGEQLT